MGINFFFSALHIQGMMTSSFEAIGGMMILYGLNLILSLIISSVRKHDGIRKPLTQSIFIDAIIFLGMELLVIGGLLWASSASPFEIIVFGGYMFQAIVNMLTSLATLVSG